MSGYIKRAKKREQQVKTNLKDEKPPIYAGPCIPFIRDSAEMKNREAHPNKSVKNQHQKQAPFEKDEKDHYTCATGVPVFYIGDKQKVKNIDEQFSKKRHALQTLNGKVFDTRVVTNLWDLLRYTTFYGICHTKKATHPFKKIMTNKNEHFDAVYSGQYDMANMTFTHPIYHPKGLIHQDSYKRVHVKTSDLLTTSFFNFNFDVAESLRKIQNNTSTEFTYKKVFLDDKETLEKERWILNPDFYDISKMEWYKEWYGKKMPESLNKNERLVPIFHKVCGKTGIFNHLEKELLMEKTIKEYKKLTDRTNDKKAAKELLTKINLEKELFKLNRNFIHLKVLGGVKNQHSVPFNGAMSVALKMDSTS